MSMRVDQSEMLEISAISSFSIHCLIFLCSLTSKVQKSGRYRDTVRSVQSTGVIFEGRESACYGIIVA